MLQRLLLAFFISQSIYGQVDKVKEGELSKRILADPKVAAVKISGERQTPSLILFEKSSVPYSKDQATSLLNDYLSVRPGLDQMPIQKQTDLPANFQVVEFAQFYKGIKVEYGGFKALAKDGNLLLMNGSWYDLSSSITTRPVLAKESALQKAKDRVNAKKYATDFFTEQIEKTNDPVIKQALAEEMTNASPKGELVIIKDFTKPGADMRLAWKFDIYATEPMSRSWIYVDAKDGRILFRDAIIKHASPELPPSITTTVQTRYAGSRSIRVKQISGNDPQNGLLLQSSHPMNEVYIPGTLTWVLMDDTRGKGIETYDLNGVGGVPVSIGAFYAQGKSFTDVDNNWSLLEHKRSDPLGNGIGENGLLEAENDDISWDAHWGAEMVYDYWLLKHNRRSFDDRDAKIKSFVHYGVAYDNAFWNGSVMTYGDGSGPAADGFKALTSLDVCAHEIGHGICTYTSNLVYARESGAMNEGFSDIWASCVERFAITSVDPTLVNRYRPFYIGEQIGATNDLPLRRMDNPKAFSDPDTYAGQFWRDPNCDPPDLLLNDFCGVHTNSGLLNKWFYLLTVGSGAGSGPDAQYARPDSDDGINDLANSYSVTGVGFNVSEQIAFLTEVMLSPTATFAEARDLSISAATAFSGDACSNVVRSVTNAWYAVGVGPEFNPSCVSTFGFVYQNGRTVSEANAPGGCTGEYLVKVPVLMPANSTATVTATGTAVNTVDYRIGSTALSNTNAFNTVVDLLVYIKGDAIVEATETISLSITITNTGSNPVRQNFVLSIADDDIEPIIGSGVLSLLSGGNFDGQPDGYSSPAGWTKTVEVPGVNLWGVWGGQLKITGNLEGVQLPPGNYNNLSETSTYISAPQIDARGLSNIKLKFDFRMQGEVDANGANPDTWGVFDYMTIVYSFDGVNYDDLRLLGEQFKAFCSLTPTEGTFEAILPASFNNTTFYIGFKWYNDTNAGGPESISVDNVTVEASPKLIENDLNHNGRENMGPGVDAYYYSVQDGQVLGKFKNNSSKNFGCTNIYVEKTGNAAFNLFQGRSGLHKTADKIIRIETSIITKASAIAKFLFTEQQLVALESATGQSRSAFRIYHVNAASYLQASNNNTDILVPVYATLPNGAGGTFTVTLNDRSYANGSYALGSVVSVPGTEMIVSGLPEEKLGLSLGKIYPNPGGKDAYINVYSDRPLKLSIEYVNSLGQQINAQAVQLLPGNSRVSLKMDHLIPGSYMIRFRDEYGNLISSQIYIRH
jgi:Zn-dependent metalloprotease